MVVSILHRATGAGMGVVGAALFVWWLWAAASGPAAFDTFLYYVWSAGPDDMIGLVANIAGRIVLIGLTWAFFQHLGTGLRHFVLDIGAGYELKANRLGALATMGFAVVATALVWGWVMFGGMI